jgi:hypothetical protein
MTTPSTKMDNFLAQVSVQQDTSGADAASWTASVTRKLNDININTIPMLVSQIHLVNTRLCHVGHTLLRLSTLDMMVCEAVRMRR